MDSWTEINTETLSADQKQKIMEIWNTEYPERLSYKSDVAFDQYLKVIESPRHTLIMNGDVLMAWFCQFLRDDEEWFAMIVSSTFQGQGIGAKLLTKASPLSGVLNGWVIDHNNDTKPDGEQYRSPVEFYKKNGFEVLSDQRLETAVISAVKIRKSYV